MMVMEEVVDMDIGNLLPFKNHPFRIRDDESLRLLMESIRKNGILSPILVVPDRNGQYRIISGHRRKHCAELLGYKKVPVIIRDMPVEECVISMVDSNLHREHISYSEKAYAYHMKNEALNALIAPVGKYWWSYKRSWPQLTMYAEDGAHASASGSDFAAKYIWNAITDDISSKMLSNMKTIIEKKK